MLGIKLCLFSILICQLSASNLTLTVYPKLPKELLTPLELMCTFEVNQEQQQSGGENNYLPYYMHIINDKQTLLGVISIYRPAGVKAENGNLQVEGHLSSNSSDSKTSYLKLTWKRSRSDLRGYYTCTAHARNDNNMETVFTTTVSVNVQKPSSEEVMTFLNNHATVVDNMDDKNEMNYKEQMKISENIQNLTATVDNRFSEMESKLNALTVSTTRHVETGEVGCGQNAGGFNLVDGNNKYKEAPIVFQRPFTSPPIVIYSIRVVDLDKGQNTRYFTYTKDITSQGFKLVCGTWADSHIYLFQVIWHAFN